MQTKFDIGDKVFLTCTVEKIEITTNKFTNLTDIQYLIRMNNEDGGYSVTVSEDSLILKKKGATKNGNEVG